MSHLTLFEDNDTILRVGTTAEPLTDASDGSKLSGATVTATVRTTTGGTVSGASNVSLSETTNTGVYTGTVSSTAGVVAGNRYRVDVLVTGAGGQDADWELLAKARKRYQ